MALASRNVRARRSSISLPSAQARLVEFATRNVVVHFAPQTYIGVRVHAAPTARAIREVLPQLADHEVYTVYATTVDAPTQRLIPLGEILSGRNEVMWWPPGGGAMVAAGYNVMADGLVARLQPAIRNLAERRALVTETLSEFSALPTDLIAFDIAPYIAYRRRRQSSSRTSYK